MKLSDIAPERVYLFKVQNYGSAWAAGMVECTEEPGWLRGHVALDDCYGTKCAIVNWLGGGQSRMRLTRIDDAYYLGGLHENIIRPITHQFVQAEIKRRADSVAAAKRELDKAEEALNKPTACTGYGIYGSPQFWEKNGFN